MRCIRKTLKLCLQWGPWLKWCRISSRHHKLPITVSALFVCWLFLRIFGGGEPWNTRRKRCQASPSCSAPPLLDSAAAIRRHRSGGSRQATFGLNTPGGRQACSHACMHVHYQHNDSKELVWWCLLKPSVALPLQKWHNIWSLRDASASCVWFKQERSRVECWGHLFKRSFANDVVIKIVLRASAVRARAGLDRSAVCTRTHTIH